MNRKCQDYSAALTSLDYRAICEMSHQFSGEVYDIISNQKVRELTGLVRELGGLEFSIGQVMERLERQLGETGNAVFEMGSMLGLLELCHRLERQTQIERKAGRSRTGYKDSILRCLYEQGVMLHKDLAAGLGVSPSNLSNIVQRLQNEEIELVKIHELGKYKYYMLTSYGQNYVRKYLLQPSEHKTVPRGHREKYIFCRMEIEINNEIRKNRIEGSRGKEEYYSELLDAIKLFSQKSKSKVEEPVWPEFAGRTEKSKISYRDLEAIG